MLNIDKNINKVISILSISCVLFISFEQMVSASQLFSFNKKAMNVSINENNYLDSYLSEEKSPIKNRLIQSQLYSASNKKRPHVPSFKLTTLASDQGALASTAGNFNGAWNASVDPRTGNASFSLTVASVLYDNGQAKRDLTLSYSGSPSARGRDTFSLGPHWGFNVGTEQVSPYEVEGHKTTGIVTGDGHAFTMRSDRNNRGETVWRPLHHKLGDVVFAGKPNSWTVSKATDTREHIVNGYVQWEQARDGSKLYFYYDSNSVVKVQDD